MNLLPAVLAALDAEHDHRAAFAAKVLLVEREHGVVLQAREADPFDLGMRLEVLRHRQRVFAMALDAQRQRLDALEEHPGIVRRDAGAEIAQRHRPHAEDERQRLERLGQINAPAQAVVAVVRRRVERVLARRPVEPAAVHHHAADARAVPAEPFGQRMDHDVRAVGQRLGQVRRRERRVHDQRQAVRRARPSPRLRGR